jgi:hypothetical protein
MEEAGTVNPEIPVAPVAILAGKAVPAEIAVISPVPAGHVHE